MVDIREAATRQIGPLPAWAWGAVIGGGLLVYRVATGGGGGASSPFVQPLAGAIDYDDHGGSGSGGGGGGGGGGSTPSVPGSGTIAKYLSWAIPAQGVWLYDKSGKQIRWLEQKPWALRFDPNKVTIGGKEYYRIVNDSANINGLLVVASNKTPTPVGDTRYYPGMPQWASASAFDPLRELREVPTAGVPVMQDGAPAIRIPPIGASASGGAGLATISDHLMLASPRVGDSMRVRPVPLPTLPVAVPPATVGVGGVLIAARNRLQGALPPTTHAPSMRRGIDLRAIPRYGYDEVFVPFSRTILRRPTTP